MLNTDFMIRKCLFILTLVFSLSTSHAFGDRDIWYVLRQSFRLRDQSHHPEVMAQIAYLKAHPAYFTAFAKNSQRYLYFILESIKAERLPGEIALLPMIESNYNPFAYSHAGAAGLWQLMPGTGSGLGVKQDWWYDGRRGILNSTRAAISYLSYLNRFFDGNWILTFAAYDSGEGTVQRAIQDNIKHNRQTDFWSLPLPRETQAYLPRLLALASIIKYPKYFGVSLPYAKYEPAFQEIEVGSQIDLTHAAKLAHMSYRELLKFNPGHNRWATAPSKTQTLLIPIEKVDTFQENLMKVPRNELISWSRHKVIEGETLGHIAVKEKSSINLIKEINHLKTNQIKSGQTLLIPATSNLPSDRIAIAKKDRPLSINQHMGPHQVIHIVQKEDTLHSLTQKYHVKESEILFWNQLNANTSLKLGDKITIWQKKPLPFIYRVRKGDSISRIAHRFHIKQADLKRWNPKLYSNSRLTINQRLIVYS